MNTCLPFLQIFFNLFISVTALAGPIEKFREMSLVNSAGKPAPIESIFEQNGQALLAVVSIATGCPMIQKSFVKYERLSKKWSGKKVKFIYLDSSPNFKIRETLNEVKKFKAGIPVYFDETQLLTKALGFQSTNQIVLINLAKSEVVYVGAIDNSLNYYTQKAEKIEFAQTALEQFFGNKYIEPAKTEAFGCAITFKKP